MKGTEEARSDMRRAALAVWWFGFITTMVGAVMALLEDRRGCGFDRIQGTYFILATLAFGMAFMSLGTMLMISARSRQTQSP